MRFVIAYFLKLLSISHDGELREAFEYRLKKATSSQYTSLRANDN